MIFRSSYAIFYRCHFLDGENRIGTRMEMEEDDRAARVLLSSQCLSAPLLLLHRSSCSAMLSAVFLTQPCSQLLLFLVVAAFSTGLAGDSWLRKIKKHYQPPPSPIAAPPFATLRLDGHGFCPPPASRSHMLLLVS